MDKTILITGGAGFIGSCLSAYLLQKGFSVVCIDNCLFGGESILGLMPDPNFIFSKGDIRDKEFLNSEIQKYGVDTVVHLAAIVGDPACAKDPEVTNEINWNGSLNVLNAVLKCKVTRFIFASTCSNYGKMKDPNGMVDEYSALQPVSLYAELKVKFEQHLLNKEFSSFSGFTPTALRFATVYGMSPRPRFDLTINEFTKELALGRELLVFGEQFWRPYCHVSDISKAVIRVIESNPEMVAFQAFNIGSTAENYTKKMIVERIAEFLPNIAVKYVQKKEDPRDYKVNFDKAGTILKFNPQKTIEDGIGEIIRSVKDRIILDPDSSRFRNA